MMVKHYHYLNGLFVGGELKEKDLWMAEGSDLCCIIEADSWNSAAQKFNNHMGWGPYNPMLQEDGTPYPEDESYDYRNSSIIQNAKYRATRCSDAFSDGCDMWIVVDADGKQVSPHSATEEEAIVEAQLLEECGPWPENELDNTPKNSTQFWKTNRMFSKRRDYEQR